ncbi:hypothetical protein ACIBCR_10180 [Micromonospora echinospora]|uniref:hypothetical protein n=1 Tax=Micromonospora echinospora TaxID=1877 RepID=UPI0037AEF31B
MSDVQNVLLSNAHRKKIVHNLVYRHADFDAALAKWGSLFPQTFCIDEVAGQIFTISDQPCVVSVYDWNTGAYLRCFSVAGKTALSQSAVIRRINGRRWLYLRTAADTMGRVDITTLPANLTAVTPADTWTFPLMYDFDWRNGVWTCGTPISNFGDTNFINRGRFIRRNENFAEIGLMEIPALRYGGNVGSTSQYALSWIPKAQGFCEGPNCFAIGMGGGYHPDNPPPEGETLFHMHGIRVFNAGGELLAENLVPATQLIQTYSDLGLNPTFLECEGIDYAYDNFYTLNIISRAADPGSATGGLLIQQEFVPEGTPGSFEVDAVSRGYTTPTTQFSGAGMHPIGDDRKLRNQVTWQPLTTLDAALKLMRSIGQYRLAFYTPVSNLTDFAGGEFPANSYVEIINVGNLVFDVTVQSPSDTYRLRVTASSPSAGWSTVKSDTGWVDIPVAAGFSAISSQERPQIRRKEGIFYFRGGWSNAGISATGSYTVGSIPSGFSLAQNLVVQVASSNAASSACMHLSATGSIQLRAGSSVGSYYKIDGISAPVG